MHPDVITAEYRIAKRPAGRVLVDYNQNAGEDAGVGVLGAAKPRATVSTPVGWDEIAAGIEIEDFRLDNVRERFVELGDRWTPMKQKTGRLDLRRFLTPAAPPRARNARMIPFGYPPMEMRVVSRDPDRSAVAV